MEAIHKKAQPACHTLGGRVFTIGHSNVCLEDFVSLLREFDIQTIVDIRKFPGSRKFPHFNREVLSERLDTQDIKYLWLESLGGRRYSSGSQTSLNKGLRAPGFRNYADYMQTDEFRTAVGQLLSVAATSRTAVLCAEKLYWKCHRRLLSDYLLAHGIEVMHIMGPGKILPHELTPGAVIIASQYVVYPPAISPSDCLFLTPDQ